MSYGSIQYVPTWNSRPAWKIDAEPHIMTRVRRMFPKIKAERGGAALIVHSLDVARDLEWLLARYELTMTERDHALLVAAADDHRGREESFKAIIAGGRLAVDSFVEPIREPRAYQLEAADVALVNGRLLLGDAVGLGKSFAALLLLRDPKAFPALIVTLTHLPRQWVGELEASFPHMTAHVLRGTRPYDITARREHKGYMPHVLICNYHKLAGWQDHLAGVVKTVIFDEIHELRIPDSQKYTAAATIADKADVRMGLSATPVFNYGPEIHSVIDVLAKDALGSSEEFGREWCHTNEAGKKVVSDPVALGTHLRAEGLFMRRTRKDVGMELPNEPLRIPHIIDSDTKVIDAELDRIEALARLVAHGPPKEAFKAAGQLDMRMRKATGIAKAPYVCDFLEMTLEGIEDLPDGRKSKAILWGWHHEVYDIYDDRLRHLNPVFYTGKESAAVKHASEHAFVHGDSRVLVMSLRSGAGLDGLQKVCRVGIFGELDWAPAQHDQCIGRLDRDDGLEGGVLAFFLMSETGSDPIVADVLNLKRMQGEAIRDPEADLFAPVADTSGHMKRLAQVALDRRAKR